MMYPEYGPLNKALTLLHIPNPNWFGDPKMALFSIIIIEIWRGIPFYIVTFLAALQSVPKELVESSCIDGANSIQSFFKIIIPSIKSTLTFCLVMATIWALQLFDSVYVLTRGGPAKATSTMVWTIYENIFFFNRIGRGSSMSVILIILIFIITIINLKLTRFSNKDQ